MDCTKYHELISLYVDEETSGVQREAVELHLENCEGCKSYLSNQIKLRDMIRESYTKSVDIDLSASIMSRIQPAPAVKPSRMKKISVFVAAAAAVCVIAMAAMMTLHVDNNTVAGNEKLEEYVIEHVGSGSADFNGRVEAVNIEK